MDKQKQVEEMEKDIEVRMAMAKGVAGSMNNGVEGWLSEYLIERGWAKIPEGAVVFIPTEKQYAILTKEEYKTYLAMKSIETNLIEIEKDKVRKETVEKFAERLLEEAFADFSDDDYDRLCILVDEIAKEIKGGK